MSRETLDRQQVSLLKEQKSVEKQIKKKKKELKHLGDALRDRNKEIGELESEARDANRKASVLPEDAMRKIKARLEPRHRKLAREMDTILSAVDKVKTELKNLRLDHFDLGQEIQDVVRAKRALGPNAAGFFVT